MMNRFKTMLLLVLSLAAFLYFRGDGVSIKAPPPPSPRDVGESPLAAPVPELSVVEFEDALQEAPDLNTYGFCGAQNKPGFKRPGVKISYNLAISRLYKKVRSGDVDLEDAFETLEEITRTPHQHMEALVLFGLWLRSDREHRQSHRALIKALENEIPASPGLYLKMGTQLTHTPHTQWALRSLQKYLQSFPQDAVISQRAARLEVLSQVLEEFILLSEQNINLYVPKALPSHEREELLEWSVDILQEAADLLSTSSLPDLTVILFHDRSELLATSCSPTWATGRFDGMVKIFSKPGDSHQLKEILRHELLHAQLSGLTKTMVPGWFNEGLAQLFAHQTRGGRHHLKRMVEHELLMPLSSLNGPLSELEQSSDAGFAYSQSRLMVMYAINRQGEGVLAQAIEYLEAGEPPNELWQHMTEDESLLSGGFIDFVARELQGKRGR